MIIIISSFFFFYYYYIYFNLNFALLFIHLFFFMSTTCFVVVCTPLLGRSVRTTVCHTQHNPRALTLFRHHYRTLQHCSFLPSSSFTMEMVPSFFTLLPTRTNMNDETLSLSGAIVQTNEMNHNLNIYTTNPS